MATLTLQQIGERMEQKTKDLQALRARFARLHTEFNACSDELDRGESEMAELYRQFLLLTGEKGM